MLAGMNTPELISRLRAVDNLSAFARRHSIPLRTLTRMRATQYDRTPTAGTLSLLEAAFKKEAKKDARANRRAVSVSF